MQLWLDSILREDPECTIKLQLGENGMIVMSISYYNSTPIIVPLERELLQRYLNFHPPETTSKALLKKKGVEAPYAKL